MKLNELLKSKSGQIILSVIWGLGLSALFRRVCITRDCIVIQGPNPEDIQDDIYGYKKKCYKYTTDIVDCTIEKI